MRTLKDHLIFFDAECPMCDMYTKAFVKTGLLDHNGRTSYQQLTTGVCPMVDRQRAANEIALVDLRTGEVNYGIRSLFKIFAAAMPVFKGLFLFGPFVWLMSKFYAFISYNRKVIIPVNDSNSMAIQPTFKLRYRVAYLIFTWFITSLILTRYVTLLAGMVPVGGSYREYLICGGQIFFQGIIISLLAGEKKWAYLGNMMTISFAGALQLLPVLFIAPLLGAHAMAYTAYFVAVAGLMFLEHIRRSKLLHIGWVLTISWALYRAVLLFIILLN